MSFPRRLVLDTNTVMALWLFCDPRLAALDAAIAAARFQPCCRPDAVEELRRVLAYTHFGIDADEQQRLIAGYSARVTLVDGLGDAADALPLPLCRDRDDQKFLEISRDAQAEFLLTRDKALLRLARHHLVRERFSILTPERFVAEGWCQ